MLRRIRSGSLKLRPVAPGPPSNKVSPVNTTPSSGQEKQTAPGEWPGVCSTSSSTSPTEMSCPSDSSPSGVWSSGSAPRPPVVRMQQDRCAHRGRKFRRDPYVIVVGVGAEHASTRRSPMTSRMASTSCGASMTTHSASSPTTQTLLSTSNVSPSRVKVPEVTV